MGGERGSRRECLGRPMTRGIHARGVGGSLPRLLLNKPRAQRCGAARKTLEADWWDSSSAKIASADGAPNVRNVTPSRLPNELSASGSRGRRPRTKFNRGQVAALGYRRRDRHGTEAQVAGGTGPVLCPPASGGWTLERTASRRLSLRGPPASITRIAGASRRFRIERARE